MTNATIANELRHFIESVVSGEWNEETDADALAIASHEASEAWQGSGFYALYNDGHSWGYQDPEWYDAPEQLALSLYSEAMQATYNQTVWAEALGYGRAF